MMRMSPKAETITLLNGMADDDRHDRELREECAAVIAAFFAAGGRMIDSSPMYGSSQPTIGYGLRKLGFNRLSFGVQDFDEQVQIAVNRIQTEEQTRDLVQAARDAQQLDHERGEEHEHHPHREAPRDDELMQQHRLHRHLHQ